MFVHPKGKGEASEMFPQDGAVRICWILYFGVIILDRLGENRLERRLESRRGGLVRRRCSRGHGSVVTEPLLATIRT